MTQAQRVRTVFRRVHLTAGLLAFLTILTFWLSTVGTELIGHTDAIVVVKQAIPWGFLLLIPAMVVAGATGVRLAGKATDPRVIRKKRRMPLVAVNGFVILVPSALALSVLAGRGLFGGLFVTVQIVELVAGAANIVLMALNIRDGLSLSGHGKLIRKLTWPAKLKRPARLKWPAKVRVPASIRRLLRR